MKHTKNKNSVIESIKNTITKNHSRAVKSLSVIVVLFGFLSFYGFNCAPSSFHVSDQASLSLSADGTLVPTYDTTPILPQALLTSPQVYQSLLNLTEQNTTVTNGQTNEFNRREGAFAASSELNLVNAPMMLALASFSGEVCNGLVQREQGQQATARKYFQAVNFQAAVSALDNESYNQVVTNMANSFWGRAPSSDEITLFNTYRTDFIAAIPTEQINQAAPTRSLILSTCSAMLASFDVFTY